MSRVERIGCASLYLGDCREILPALTERADLILTDPPYSISSPGTGRWEQRYGRTRGDLDFFEGDSNWREMTAIVCEAVAAATAQLEAHGSVYVWCGHRQFGAIVEQLEAAGWGTRFMVWSKTHPVPAAPGAGWSSGAALCVYAYRPGRRWAWKGSCPYKSNVLEADAFRYGQPDKSGHPTQMPIAVVRPLIEASSKIGDLILDPFMGSGTTGVAALKMQRVFIGIEKEMPYFDMACRRIEAAERQHELFFEAAE